jgi:hypothetical protein
MLIQAIGKSETFAITFCPHQIIDLVPFYEKLRYQIYDLAIEKAELFSFTPCTAIYTRVIWNLIEIKNQNFALKALIKNLFLSLKKILAFLQTNFNKSMILECLFETT